MPLPRLRAPRDHGGVLAVPPLAEVGTLLDGNRRLFERTDVRILGRPLQELQRLAREDATAAAGHFLDRLGLARPPQVDSRSLVLTGHQPELFHPGVWIKNFAIHGLAQRHEATPINLIVDNDAAKAPAIRVPVQERSHWRTVHVPFDEGTGGAAPYEELVVRDESRFAAFPDAVDEQTRNVNLEPLLPTLWQAALRLRTRTPLLGERLAGARHAIEESWGCRNLELPISAMSETEAFAWFAGSVLADLPRFQQVYNEELKAYRKRQRIRSRNHPVPELATQGDWLEAPLWAWRGGENTRSRLFARVSPRRIELRAGAILAELPPPGQDATDFIGAWRALAGTGVKIRTRALTTTLFARVFLADLFVHGIGGAVYDELTDAILRGYFGLTPPAFLVLSATMHLPLPQPLAASRDLPTIDRRLRALWYSPDRFLNLESAHELVKRKRRLVCESPVDANAKRERFQAILALNEELRPFVEAQRQALLTGRAGAVEELASLRVCRDREFAFCLHPEAELRRVLTPFAK